MSAVSSTELVLLLSNLTTRMQKRFGGALTPHGLSFTEYLVLRELAGAPSKKLRRIDLAETIGLSASGVTRLLNPMEKVGLVKKEDAPRDARVSLVAITRAGEKIFRDSDVAIGHSAEAFLSALGETDRKTFNRLATTLL